MTNAEQQLGGGVHLVILVHGICDPGEWIQELRSCLEKAGFKVEPGGYEFVDLVQFLLPVQWFRRRAIRRVWTHIRAAKQLHPDAQKVSIIAHSFGTYIVSKILSDEFDFKAHRLIFCGSVAESKLPLAHMQRRFTAPILNCIGTRDVWPVIAETVTWGYGSVGRLGFKQPGVVDCFHNGLRHGDFLKAEFCETHWVPFLKVGTQHASSGPIERLPLWLRFFVVFQPKYLLLLVIALFALTWWCRPATVVVERGGGNGARVVSQNILEAAEAAERPCVWPCRIPGFRYDGKQVSLRNEDMLRNLYVCSSEPIRFEYREGVEGLTRLRDFVPCLDVQQPDAHRIVVSVRESDAVPIRGQKSGNHGWMCRAQRDCSDAVRALLDGE